MDVLSTKWSIVVSAASTRDGKTASSTVRARNSLTQGSSSEIHEFAPTTSVPVSSVDLSSSYPYQSTAEHMPLRQFVHEVLRRARTSYACLAFALCYVEAIASKLPHLVQTETRRHPSSNGSPLLCARRTFLASILLASKFIQDNPYSNKAWSRMTGLPAKEVSRCERIVAIALVKSEYLPFFSTFVLFRYCVQ